MRSCLSLPAAVMLVLIMISGCGSDAATPPTPAAPASPVTATSRSLVEQECGQTVPTVARVTDLDLRSADGVTLHAAVVDGGRRGVILLHQTDNGLCGWLPYAGVLASRGFQVGLLDFRCTFNSSCPDGENAHNVTADVKAMAAELRRRGAMSLAVVGASYGGAVAIGTCAAVRADACVALSPALYDSKLGGGTTATKVIRSLRVPLLFAVAPDDDSSPREQNQALLRQARPGIVTVVELPSGAGHGWETVADPDAPGQWSAFSDQLIEFITTHS
jgi:predicted alpha/beta hydrolase